MPPRPSATCSPTSASPDSNKTNSIAIEVEIVSEDEMAFIESALTLTLASARPLLLSSRALSPSRSHFTSSLRPLRPPPRSHSPDVEDSAPSGSRLSRFRSRRALWVTDLTSVEWCPKQKEFKLEYGKPPRTEAMIAGANRHKQLEKEVIEKVHIVTKSIEDSWAVNLLNYVVGANQLLSEGLTRELPVIGAIQGTWVVGVIDEIRILKAESIQNPLLIDTKTRQKATHPAEAQKRNGRFQLMCYKYLYDGLVIEPFPMDHFFNYFGLNSQHNLSEDVQKCAASLGIHVKTLEDMVLCFKETCGLMPSSQDQLRLRYEHQSDHTLIGEDQFGYDAVLFNNCIKKCLGFWVGDQEASYVPTAEKWKCGYCPFKEVCQMTAKAGNK